MCSSLDGSQNRAATSTAASWAIRNWIAQADRDDGRREDGLTTAERDELSRLRRENDVGRRVFRPSWGQHQFSMNSFQFAHLRRQLPQFPLFAPASLACGANVKCCQRASRGNPYPTSSIFARIA